MKKEVDILDVFSKNGKIGVSKSEVIITILDCGAVVETDYIASVKEVYFNKENDDITRTKVRDFLIERGLKLFVITLKCGTNIGNCIMRADKPLKSFFD